MQNNTSKVNTVLLVIVIILLAIGIWAVLSKKQNTNIETYNFPTSTDLNQKDNNPILPVKTPTTNTTTQPQVNSQPAVAINTTLPAPYVRQPADGNWPPVIKNSSVSYSCNPGEHAATRNEEGYSEQEKSISGKSYCIQTMSDGFAGGHGTTYTYKTSNGSDSKTTTFTLLFSSCGVYGGPGEAQYNECNSVINTFTGNLDNLIARLMN